MDILIRTLNQLPEGDDCIWQGGWLRLPNWLAEEGQKPVRMWTFFWTNPAFGYLHSSCSAHRREECSVDIPIRELISFARTPQHAGCRPRIVQVNDRDLARELAETRTSMLRRVSMASPLAFSVGKVSPSSRSAPLPRRQRSSTGPRRGRSCRPMIRSSSRPRSPPHR
jgi:hypothetical protein